MTDRGSQQVENYLQWCEWLATLNYRYRLSYTPLMCLPRFPDSVQSIIGAAVMQTIRPGTVYVDLRGPALFLSLIRRMRHTELPYRQLLLPDLLESESLRDRLEASLRDHYRIAVDRHPDLPLPSESEFMERTMDALHTYHTGQRSHPHEGWIGFAHTRIQVFDPRTDRQYLIVRTIAENPILQFSAADRIGIPYMTLVTVPPEDSPSAQYRWVRSWTDEELAMPGRINRRIVWSIFASVVDAVDILPAPVARKSIAKQYFPIYFARPGSDSDRVRDALAYIRQRFPRQRAALSDLVRMSEHLPHEDATGMATLLFHVARMHLRRAEKQSHEVPETIRALHHTTDRLGSLFQLQTEYFQLERLGRNGRICPNGCAATLVLPADGQDRSVQDLVIGYNQMEVD